MTAVRTAPSAVHDPDALVIATPRPDPRLPDAFVGVAALAATLLASSIVVEAGHISSDTALAVMAAAVGLVAWWCRPRAAAVPAVCGMLMLNGFFVDRSGDLHWHGWADVVRLVVLFGVAAVVSLSRAALIGVTGRVTITEYPIGTRVIGPSVPEPRSATTETTAHLHAPRGEPHA
jgi:hypothetical protein